MIKKLGFTTAFVALLNGEDAEAKAKKAKEQAITAITTRLAVLNGKTLDLKEDVISAENDLLMARVNFGEPISYRSAYVDKLVSYKNQLTTAETKLEDHENMVKFLNEELKTIQTEE